MAITLSHGGPTIYRSSAPSRQVLVGTIEGVVLSSVIPPARDGTSPTGR